MEKKETRMIVIVFMICLLIVGSSAYMAGKMSNHFYGKQDDSLPVISCPPCDPCPELVLTPCPENYCIYNDLMGYKEIYWKMGAFKCMGIKRYDSDRVEMYTCK